MDRIVTTLPKHPLDPLTSSEIALFREILVEAGLVKESSRLGYVLLKEPEKSKVWAFKPGDDFERAINAVIYDTAAKVRSEERRVGKECGSRCKFRGAPYNKK